MSVNSKYQEIGQKVFPLLIQYVPVVDRVHGAHHPEFHEVRALFDTIIKKTKANNQVQPELNVEFAQLRKITHDYTVPKDVCETYEAVYTMLKAINEAYQD